MAPVLVDLSKLSDVVKNDVKKENYNAKIKDIEDKIPDISKLASNTTFNYKVNKVKGEIPRITNLLLLKLLRKKYLTRVKYFAASEFNELTAENLTVRVKWANLTTETNTAGVTNETDFDDKLKKLNKKVTSNKGKHAVIDNEWNKLQNIVEKLEKYDSSVYWWKLLFQWWSITLLNISYFYYSFRRILITVKVISWESKDLSESIVTPNNNLSATIKWYRNLNFSLVSKGSCLKQDRAAFSCRNIINVYVFCELDTWS